MFAQKNLSQNLKTPEIQIQPHHKVKLVRFQSNKYINNQRSDTDADVELTAVLVLLAFIVFFLYSNIYKKENGNKAMDIVEKNEEFNIKRSARKIDFGIINLSILS